MSKPIDQSRPSNRRCWNCKHFENAKLAEEGDFTEERKLRCETGGCEIRYWNRCAYFEWNPNKVYKEAMKNE